MAQLRIHTYTCKACPNISKTNSKLDALNQQFTSSTANYYLLNGPIHKQLSRDLQHSSWITQQQLPRVVNGPDREMSASHLEVLDAVFEVKSHETGPLSHVKHNKTIQIDLDQCIVKVFQDISRHQCFFSIATLILFRLFTVISIDIAFVTWLHLRVHFGQNR